MVVNSVADLLLEPDLLEQIADAIVELQQAKQSLADTVTGSADGAILSMKPEELLQLLGEEA